MTFFRILSLVWCLRSYCQTQGLLDFLLCFLGLKVLHFTLRSMIHLGLIFVNGGARSAPRWMFCLWMSSGLAALVEKMLLCPTVTLSMMYVGTLKYVVQVFWIQVLITWFTNMLSSCTAGFFVLQCLLRSRSRNFFIVQFVNFFLLRILLLVFYLRNLCLVQGSNSFPFITFMFYIWTFESVIFFVLMFAHGVGYASCVYLLQHPTCLGSCCIDCPCTWVLISGMCVLFPRLFVWFDADTTVSWSL